MEFLTLEKEAFGLDISDLSLKIVKLTNKKGFFRLASFGKMDIDPGIIEKGVIQDEDALAKIIKVACRKVKGKRLNTRYVVASLPEEKSFLQVIQMPRMEEKELESAIRFEAENYIPLPIGEVYLDFHAIAPIKDHLNHLDVLIAALPKKIINSYVSCFKKAGLIPIALEVESQAIARALIKNEITDYPLALIDFGKSSTDFIVFAGRSIQFTYSIPTSSEQLTAAISKALDVNFEKAEKIKMGYDLINPKADARSNKITQAVTPILADLATQIKKYINFYQDHAAHEHLAYDKKIEKIILCGGGANLKGLPEFFSENLSIPVELGDFWVNFSSKKINHAINSDPLSFVTALGLALREIKNPS